MPRDRYNFPFYGYFLHPYESLSSVCIRVQNYLGNYVPALICSPTSASTLSGLTSSLIGWRTPLRWARPGIRTWPSPSSRRRRCWARRHRKTIRKCHNSGQHHTPVDAHFLAQEAQHWKDFIGKVRACIHIHLYHAISAIRSAYRESVAVTFLVVLRAMWIVLMNLFLLQGKAAARPRH